ncbi:unnamed protein product [Lactuca virosa]|uniref:Secreted protein n=1 Tax=Lactuca virosa TaxID=75947 RepID=A0AAU9N2T4_9ASTR|nr:unnamed protein product [Lactuca virosa]
MEVVLTKLTVPILLLLKGTSVNLQTESLIPWNEGTMGMELQAVEVLYVGSLDGSRYFKILMPVRLMQVCWTFATAGAPWTKEEHMTFLLG